MTVLKVTSVEEYAMVLDVMRYTISFSSAGIRHKVSDLSYHPLPLGKFRLKFTYFFSFIVFILMSKFVFFFYRKRRFERSYWFYWRYTENVEKNKNSSFNKINNIL